MKPLSPCVLLIALSLLGAPSLTQASEEVNRDEAIFGEAAATDETLEEALESSLEARNRQTTVGGQLYSRVSYSLNKEDSALNSPINSPSLADIYLDSRPNDHLRGYMRGRFHYTFSFQDTNAASPWGPASQSDFSLDQLWFKFNIAERVYVTFGKQPLRWGSGRFWNPTDFVNSQTRDPLAFVDERTGLGLLKLHLPLEDLGWNFYAIINGDGAQSPNEAGFALRGEFLFQTTEISISAADRKGGPEQLGLDISTGVGPFDLHLETAAHRRTPTLFFKGSSEAPIGYPVFGYDPIPELTSRDEWLYQAVAGIEFGINYSDEDTLYIGAEFFYNQMGYQNPELFTWLAATGSFRPLYLGEQYASLYLALPNPGQLKHSSVTLSGLANLSFDSYITRLDYRVRALTFLDFFMGVTGYFGKSSDLRFAANVDGRPLSESEESLVKSGLQNRTVLNDDDINSIIAIMNQGLSIPQRLIDFQVGLRMDF